MKNSVKRNSAFGRFAKWISCKSGSPFTFIAAFMIVIAWFISGPLFGYSDTWQLVINTGTTIITFLMVFVIQNTQNKDTMAIQLKLDELLRATEGAHNALMDLEELREQELNAIRKRYLHLAASARENLRNGKSDTNKPEVSEDFDMTEN